MTYDGKENRRYSLVRQIADAQAALDALEIVPGADDYPVGTIIRANISWGGYTDLTYVFLKVLNGEAVRWYHTGEIRKPSNHLNVGFFAGWEALQRWLVEHGRRVESWDVMVLQNDSTVVFHNDDDLKVGNYALRRHADGTYRL